MVSPQYCFQNGNSIIELSYVKEEITIIDFSPLWTTMKEKGVTQYQLLKNGIDNKTLDSLKKNKNITLVTLEKLCRILECEPNDVVKFTD